MYNPDCKRPKKYKTTDRKTEFKKKIMLKSLDSTLGVVKAASDICGVSRQLHYKWYREDEEYAQACDDMVEESIDFAETKLLKQIEDGNTQATIFFLKSKGKHRGYTESATLDISNNDGSLAPTMIQLVAQPDLTIEGENVQEALIHHEDRTEK